MILSIMPFDGGPIPWLKVSYSLNSLKKGYIENFIGDYDKGLSKGIPGVFTIAQVTVCMAFHCLVKRKSAHTVPI